MSDNRIYITQLPSAKGSDQFIAIEHGTTGYSETTVYDQDHANALNERQGITGVEAEAAVMCSMFGTWNKFDSLVERLSARSAA